MLIKKILRYSEDVKGMSSKQRQAMQNPCPVPLILLFVYPNCHEAFYYLIYYL
jgi:hypothetical protein